MVNQSTSHVYLMMSESGDVLYVGQTNRTSLRRSIEHAQTKDWWGEVDSMRTVEVSTPYAARAMEEYLIWRYRPPYNDQMPDVESRFRVGRRLWTEHALRSRTSAFGHRASEGLAKSP